VRARLDDGALAAQQRARARAHDLAAARVQQRDQRRHRAGLPRGMRMQRHLPAARADHISEPASHGDLRPDQIYVAAWTQKSVFERPEEAVANSHAQSSARRAGTAACTITAHAHPHTRS